MENKVSIDKCKDYRNNMMRIFVDTGVPVKYMLNDDIMSIMVDQLLDKVNEMDEMNGILFDGELDSTINKIFLFSSVVCSQVLRDIDEHDIKDITDIIKYLQYRNITDVRLFSTLTMIAITEEDNQLDMDTIIPLIGLSLTSYLEDNILILSNIMDSIDVYANTLDVDDLVYNI